MGDQNQCRAQRQYHISVVIPTYNRANTIERALQSVLAQTRSAQEIIVVDDGSTDDTAELIETKFADSVVYHYQSNRGVSHARNTGIKIASGDWIAFLDSDDEWLPGKLQAQVEALNKQSDYLFCHTDEIWMRNGKRVNPMNKHGKSGGHIFERCLPLCVISPSSVLMRKSLFEIIGWFDESMPACEDYDYWLRFCSQYPVLYVDVPQLVKYGGHQDQLSRKYWGMDQFRISALLKILAMGVLSSQQKSAVINMVKDKCMILEKGAQKHANDEMLQYCQDVRLRLEYFNYHPEIVSQSS